MELLIKCDVYHPDHPLPFPHLNDHLIDLHNMVTNTFTKNSIHALGKKPHCWVAELDWPLCQCYKGSFSDPLRGHLILLASSRHLLARPLNNPNPTLLSGNTFVHCISHFRSNKLIYTAYNCISRGIVCMLRMLSGLCNRSCKTRSSLVVVTKLSSKSLLGPRSVHVPGYFNSGSKERRTSFRHLRCCVAFTDAILFFFSVEICQFFFG